jgi:hypothetical protein
MILLFLLACATLFPSTEVQCREGVNFHGPTNPACWPYLPCSDMAFSLTNYSSATCRPDQDSTIQWEPQNGPRTENEDRVGGVLVCTCRSTQ